MVSKAITTSTAPWVGFVLFVFLKKLIYQENYGLDTECALNPNPNLLCDFEKNYVISQLRFLYL